MKIVHICLCGIMAEGWTYQENLLTKYQVKNGHQVSIITSQWIMDRDGNYIMDDKTDYVNDDAVHIIRLKMKGRESFEKKFKCYKKLYITIEEEKPDFLFIHNPAFVDTGEIRRYLKLHPKVIAVADNHADFSNSGTNFISKNILHKIIWRYYAGKLIPYITRYYGVTPGRIDFMVNIYKVPREKCGLLVMGADDELVVKCERDENIARWRNNNHIRPTDFLIVSGGKIDKYKRQTLALMRAVKDIKFSSVRLIIFGSVEKDMEKEFYSLCGEVKVQYIGWKKGKDLYDVIASADLAVYPGRHSVLWEQTVGQGIPLIVKKWEGTQHVNVNGNCRFLEKESVEEIYDMITKLLENEQEYAEMKSNAYTAKRKFLYGYIAKRSVMV